MKKKLNLPLAVCLVLEGPCETFLGVTRRNNPASWCFPGGKVDKGETPEKAIVREVLEETGLRIFPSGLKKIYIGLDSIVNPYQVISFVCNDNNEWFNDQKLIQCENDIQVGFVPVSYLMNGEFGEYNRRVLKKYHTYKLT